MVYTVTAENRHLFTKELRQMWRQRHAVFVRTFQWNIPNESKEPGMEIDSFDTGKTIYLMTSTADGRVSASIRLNPTNEPHLMSELFEDMCLGGVPAGDNIWEASRFYVWAPRATHEERIQLGLQLQCAMIELSLLYGVEKLTFVISMNFLAMLTGLGIDARPLGLPVEMHGEPQVACECMVTPAALQSLREMLELRGSILEMEPSRQVA